MNDTAPQAFQDLYVVVPPSADAEAWRAAIAATAPTDLMPRLQIRSDADGLEQVDPAHLAVIMTRPETGYGDAASQSLTEASRILALASDLPAGTTFITDETVKAGSSVTLFSAEIPSAHAVSSPTAGPESKALALYRKGPPAVGARAEWEPGLFSLDHKASANAPVPGVLDLPGRARCLFHGPYFWLPRGEWRATVHFVVDELACDRNLRFEWGGAERYSELSVQPGKPGYYAAQLHLHLAEAEAMELRLILPESALVGRLTLQLVTIERMAEA